MRLVWTAKYAAVAVAVVLLTGCGNDGEAVDFKGSSAALAESPVPNAADLAVPAPGGDPSRDTAVVRSRPTPPASLDQRGRGAALDFARYAVEVLNHAQATGYTTDLKRISLGSCRDCNGRIDELRVVYGQGGFVEGGSRRVLSSSVVSDGRNRWDVSLTVHVTRQRLKRSAGARVEFLQGGRHEVGMSVARTADGWVVTALTGS